MKVGILTFHRANNYGAVLQCFALQTYLKKMGHEVEIVDYRQKNIEIIYNTFNWNAFIAWLRHPKGLLYYLLKIKYRRNRNSLFNDFASLHLVKSVPYFGKGVLKYDSLIYGSDQIWNPKLTGGKLDFVYLGNSKTSMQCKKIAYAISFENKPFSNDDLSLLKKALLNFSAFSLRENALCKYLGGLTSLPLHVVADPTLLLNSNDYKEVIQKPKFSKKYVLVYAVGPKEIALNVAKKIALERQYDIIDISEKNISPMEFLGYIWYAWYVVAVSFHGTVFSMLFKKDFYTVATGQTSDVRYYNLLSNLKMTDRCITRVPDIITAVDYSKFEDNKNAYLKSSKLYLASNIS